MSKEYFFMIASKYLAYLKHIGKIDKKIQAIYNENKYDYDALSNSTLLMDLEEYNLSLNVPYLASGQSCYFNESVDANGLYNFKLRQQDIDDARFISQCFGVTTNYHDVSIPIIYTTLLGTTEFNYATQTFPAGIFEDVFQCSPLHDFPIQPIVGETEQDFFLRLLKYQIEHSESFNMEYAEEVLKRGKRLINNFCAGKNRVYLIPLDDVLSTKASFGDILGSRNGNMSSEQLNQIIGELPTFKELLITYISYYNGRDSYENMAKTFSLYQDANMTSEYGIALYGKIPTDKIKYIEVERKYQMMQKRAIDLGYQIGEIIPVDYLYADEKTIKK